VSAWWTAANAAAAAPTPDQLTALRDCRIGAAEAPDEAEAQEEMLDGLDVLAAALATGALPVVQTQHRVVGTDTCHFLAPATLVADVDSGGKLLVTSARLILVAGGVKTWPWHQVAQVTRDDRDLLVTLRGLPPVRLRMNSYEHALVACALTQRLIAARTTGPRNEDPPS
jgi:hypothetical protein